MYWYAKYTPVIVEPVGKRLSYTTYVICQRKTDIKCGGLIVKAAGGLWLIYT